MMTPYFKDFLVVYSVVTSNTEATSHHSDKPMFILSVCSWSYSTVIRKVSVKDHSLVSQVSVAVLLEGVPDFLS